MKPIPFFAIGLIALLSTACNQTQRHIQSWEKSIAYAEKNHRSFQEKDWEKLSLEMTDIRKTLENPSVSMSADQRTTMNQLLGRYAALLILSEVNSFKQNIDDFGQQLEQTLKSLEEGLE